MAAMTGREIKARLHDGRCVIGTHVLSYMNPTAAAILAGVPLDFAFVCTEHIPLGRTEVGLMCQHFLARGVSPIVRVPSPEPIGIATALDAGADGIVVPYVETVAEVRAIVGAVKFRPIKGELVRGELDGSRPLDAKTRGYLEEFNADKYVIIGVESVPAIRRLDELLAVPGVDGVFLGPHDITTSMGLPTEYTHPDFVAAVESVTRKCRARGIGVGLHTNLLQLPAEIRERYLAAGMNWLLHSADVIVLRDALNDQLARLRAVAGAAAAGAGAAGPKAGVQSCLTAERPAN